MSAANGATFQRSNFGVNQRFFSIYDGPSYQQSNAFLDITRTTLNDCDLSNNPPGPRARCDASKWMEGKVTGIPGVIRCTGTGGLICAPSGCYLPNAAIAWKQPNGFYYPPSFHSKNLYFNNVEIRHYVIEPFFYHQCPGNAGGQYRDYGLALLQRNSQYVFGKLQ